MKKTIIITVLILGISLLIKPLTPSSVTKTKQIKGEKVKTKDTLLYEAPDMQLSKHSEWWLNSGAKVNIEDNMIKTIQGDLSGEDPWRIKYNESNPTETDDGYHPQNIFRLVTRAKYSQPMQSMYFKINDYILSEDVHRSASNGVLFFNHYLDGDNLYYTGLRVDGAVVIKKKIGGKYFTMAYKIIYPEGSYDRITNPNLIPEKKWIGIKSEIINGENNTVLIRLYMDNLDAQGWKLVLEAVDDGLKYGGGGIVEKGYAGIRSDFMDVEFRDYVVSEGNVVKDINLPTKNIN